jgi:hypothetical protein
VGTKDQAMIFVRKLFHQCIFILTPRLSFCYEAKELIISSPSTR